MDVIFKPLRSIMCSTWVPQFFKYFAWAIVKYLKIKAPQRFSLKLPNGKELQLNGVESHFQVWYWWGIRAHEYDTLKIVLPIAHRIDTFWDVGAYYGQYSLMLAKQNPKLKALAFEPNPETRKIFEEQISLNQLSNIEVVPLAVSDQAGRLEFYNIKHNPSNSSLSKKRSSNAEVILVDVKSLDAVALERNESKIDLIKIDVEHHELNVLQGMKSILQNSRPLIVMEILNAFPSKEAEEVLVPANYVFFFITYDGLNRMKSLKRPSPEPKWRFKQRNPFYNFLLCPIEKQHLIEEFIIG